jgi:hypothetical protein
MSQSINNGFGLMEGVDSYLPKSPQLAKNKSQLNYQQHLYNADIETMQKEPKGLYGGLGAFSRTYLQK